MVKPNFNMDRIGFLLVGFKPISYWKLIEVHEFIAANSFKPLPFFIFLQSCFIRPGYSNNFPCEEVEEEEKATCQDTKTMGKNILLIFPFINNVHHNQEQKKQQLIYVSY